jgi:hypothetical protein
MAVGRWRRVVAHGGIVNRATWYDPSTLSPMERGRLEAHEAKLVRYEGEVSTFGELYARLEVAHVRKRGVYGRKAPVWGIYFGDDDGSLDVPALVAKCATVPDLTPEAVS